MGNCLICKTPVRFIKFKSKDGFVCKKCYEKVSINFSQVIKSKTKEELLVNYHKDPFENKDEDFEITRKINQFLLFDDNNKKICLPNHSKYSKEILNPEFFSFSQIEGCKFELNQFKNEMGTLKVSIMINRDEGVIRDIWLIVKPIKIESTAFKTMKTLASKMVKEINGAREVGQMC